MEIPHPRDSWNLLGMAAPEHAVSDAMRRGRLHHAWMLCGPEGIGKASFAYRIARRLLGAQPDPGDGALGSRRDDNVVHQVSAQAHPDLLVLERESEGGKIKRTIPVDRVRQVADFFSRSPALAPWRVAIVDSVDDLAGPAANALLKTLEEPPQRGLLLLISHAPGSLLPTLRSRCRRLNFKPPPLDQAQAVVEALSGAGSADVASALALGAGLPGQALALLSSNSEGLDTLAEQTARGDLSPGSLEAFALIDQFRGGEGANRFDLFMTRLQDHVRRRAAACSQSGDLSAANVLARNWTRIGEVWSEVEGLNLDRGDAMFTLLRELS
jgi:DNA polymerase-3 subunit delta'